MSNSTLNKARDFIAENEPLEALETLNQYIKHTQFEPSSLNRTFRNEVILLKSDFNSLIREKRLGTIIYSDNSKANQLKKAILAFIDVLEDKIEVVGTVERTGDILIPFKAVLNIDYNNFSLEGEEWKKIITILKLKPDELIIKSVGRGSVIINGKIILSKTPQLISLLKLRLITKIIKLEYSKNQSWFKYIYDYSECRIRLNDTNLTGVNLSHTNLSRAILMDVNLSHSDLSHVNLKEANLSRADLSYANLKESNLNRAYLSNVNLADSNLKGANLNYANLMDSNLKGADLRRADLDYTYLNRSYLKKVNLKQTNLRYTDFMDANLSFADLSYTNLVYVNLSYADLSYTNLREAVLHNIRLIDTDLDKAFLNKSKAFRSQRNDFIKAKAEISEMIFTDDLTSRQISRNE